MSVCKTAMRRRAQAKNGYRHLCKKLRPNYTKADAGVAARRLAAKVDRQKSMIARKGSK
jgi:hypothetical protein